MDKRVFIVDEKELIVIVEKAVANAMKTHQSTNIDDNLDSTQFGNLDWLCSILPIPRSTVEQKSALGQIPGKIKIKSSKRVIYDKAIVINWIKNQCINTK